MPTVPNDGSLTFEDALAQSNSQPEGPDTGGGALTFEQAQQQAGAALSAQMRATTRVNADRDPLAVAEAERLGSQFGLPADVAERNLDALRQQETLAGADRLATESPNLSAWMVEDPNAAAIVRDSTQQLSTVEKVFQGYFNAVYRAPASGLVSGYGGIVSGAGETLNVLGRLQDRISHSVLKFFSEDAASQYASVMPAVRQSLPWWMMPDQLLLGAGSAVQSAGGGIKDIGQKIAVPEEQQNTLTDIGQGVGSFVPTAAMFALNPVVGTVAAGAQGVDLQADRAKEAGTYGTASADLGMALGAPVTAITERMGYGWLMKALPEPAKRAFLTRVGDILRAGAGEAAQEITESMLQDAITKAAVDENFDMFQGLDREGIAAFGVGALIRGTVHLGRMQQDAQLAGAEQREIEQIAREVDATGLRETSPQRLQQAIERLKANGRDSIYVPASEFQQLFQGEKADEVRRAAGVDDAEYVQALTTGGRIRISAEGFFAGMNPADRDALVPHARWTFEGMTPIEAEKFDPEQAIAEFYGDLGRSVDPSNRAFDYVRMALENAGATPDVAEAQAEMMAAKIRTLSYRSGMSVDRLLGEPGNERLDVRRAVSAEVQRVMERQNKNAGMDSLIDAYRSGRLFSDKEIKGQRLVTAIIKAGGIRPDAFGAGDLKAQDLDKVRPGFFSNNGMTLDQALELARQDGYIEPAPQDRPDDIGVNELNELIIEDARGDGVFPMLEHWNMNRHEFNAAVEALDNELRALGIRGDQLKAMSNADVRRALAGVVTGEGGQTLDQSVWHGSPHRGIEQTGFSLQKIGTGEGAQAYGWGLYFAGKREIAEWYRKGLSHRDMVQKFRDAMPDRADTDDALEWANSGEAPADMAAVIKALSADDWLGFDYPAQALNALFGSPENYDISPELKDAAAAMQGQLYAAEIPEDSDLLDWDAPLSEQPEKIKKALREVLQPEVDRRNAKREALNAANPGRLTHPVIGKLANKTTTVDDLSGRDAYEFLTQSLGGARQASEFLLAAGIPGLRYLDGTSRGAGDGSRNYVIWDEGAISDVRTFYQSQPAAQADQTQTPEFKRWFGDSEVVDADGKPLVFYHGGEPDFSGIKDSGRFGGGIFVRQGAPSGYGRADFPLYVRGPILELDQMRQELHRSPDALTSLIDAEGDLFDQIVDALTDGSHYPTDHDVMRAIGAIDEADAQVEIQSLRGKVAKKLGYQAVRTPDEFDGETVMVLSPSQIKSAIGNDGTFDGDDPSILSQEARGSITIGPAGYPGGLRQFLITLGEGADKSTFLHESAHFHLELLREVDAELRGADPASLTEQQRRLLADHDALLKWLGVDSFDSIEREHHEKYAETWEAYHREGRAPSTRLQRVLYKFSTWLKLIYKTLKELPNARLNDEVREIFDRMLATDDEIDAARTQQGMGALFGSADEYGMTPEEFARFQEAQRVARQSAIEAEQSEQYRYALAEQKRWRSAEMAKLREEAAGIIQSSPMYRAAYLLRSGTLPNGDPLPEGQRQVKLSRQEMVDRYGKEWVGKNLRGMVADDGMPADMVAQVLGYADGRELVDAVSKVLPREEAIKVEADRLWHERYPNPMLDGALEARVQAAVHNDLQAQVMVRELNALAKRAGMDGQPVVLQVMKQAAERMVGATKVRDLQPGRHKATEAREGKEALKAAAEGRLEDAMRARKRQLMAGLLYRETLKAQERAESHRSHAMKLAKKPAQERFAKAGWENYLDKINQILEAYEFRRVTNRELDRRTSLRAWVESQQADGEVTAVSEELLARVERNMVKNYRDATVSELDAVNDALRNIEHLANLKNKLLAGAREADKAEAVAELVARAEQSLPGLLDEDTPDARRPLGERATRAGGRALANLNRPENVIEALDGGMSGPWHDFIWTALEKAEGKMQALRTEMMARLRDVREAMPSGFMQSLNEPVTVFGIKMTRSELVSLALNTGNEGNLQRLMDGGIGDKTGAKKLSRAQVNEMVSMLTADELKFVQAMWDTVGSLWTEIEALTRRVGGVRPDRIEGRDFVAQSIDGKTVAMRGAYWPLVYDPKRSTQGENQQEATAKQALMSEGFLRAATSKGHTKARAEKVDATLKRDFAQIMSVHLDQVMTDIAYREAVRDVDSLLRTPAVKSAVIFRAGQDAYDNLQGALAYSVSASNGIAGRVATGWRWVDTVFANMSVSALAIRPDIALGNLSSAMIQGLNRVGVRALMRGLHDVMRSWQRTSNAISAKSAFMQQRINDTDFFYQQEMTKIGGQRGYGPAYRRYMMTLHRAADAVVSRSLWWGHYQSNLEKGEAEAIRLADKAIRQTQTAQGRKDLSTFERDPSFKQTRQFMGPMFVIFGRLYAAARGEGATRTVGTRAATAAIQWFLAPAIFMLAAGRWAADGDDEDEDVGANEWALWLATTVGLFPIQTLPILRDIGSGIEAVLTDKPVSPRAPPVTQAAGGMVRAGQSIAANIEAYRDGDDFDWWDMTRDLTTVGAPLVGAPASQVRITTKTIQYWMDDPEEGRTELAAMAIYGPPKDYKPQ